MDEQTSFTRPNHVNTRTSSTLVRVTPTYLEAYVSQWFPIRDTSNLIVIQVVRSDSDNMCEALCEAYIHLVGLCID